MQRLIDVQWESNDGVQDALVRTLSETIKYLNLTDDVHTQMFEDVGALLKEVKKPWTIKIKATTTIEATQTTTIDQEAAKISTWQNATIRWLANEKTFHPRVLKAARKIMKGPGGVYSSPEEYFDIVIPLWIAMTFGGGNSAITPKCRIKFNDKECGLDLFPAEGWDDRYWCRGCRSGAEVVLICDRKGHNEGLCARCATKAKSDLVGPPGRFASTHVYDGNLCRADFDGRLFINNFQSRRPPQMPIHWKRTSRLSCSNLVGVVRLSSREAPLRPDDKIFWGEIVPSGEPHFELVIRMLPSSVVFLKLHIV